MSPVVFVILQSGAQANGGLRSISEIMSGLTRHRPIVLTNLESATTGEWRRQSIEVHLVEDEASAGFKANPLGTLRTYRRYYRALSRIVADSGARLVHANDPLAFQLSAGAAKRQGARILLNLRDTLDPRRRPPKLKFRAIFGVADHALFLSREMAEAWTRVAPNAARSFDVTYSIVDLDRYAPGPGPSPGEAMVLIPGVFWPKKGQLEFIRQTVPILAECGIASWFAGDFDPAANAYAAACASEAARFGNKVRFLGFREDMPDLYRQASAIAVPSLHEGLMRGMIEAMSCGRPVVSFDVCSADEMLAGAEPAGAVVRQGDYAGMAHALTRFAGDPGAQIAAGRNGRAVAEALFNAGDVIERYEQAYGRLEQA
jgi:glycosyltransferase involved in cell wall biosynthesis